MSQRAFGRTKEGREVTEYTLVNRSGMELSVIDLGATITSIKTKGSDGRVYDVVLAYANPTDCQNGTTYFGAVIGRNANRIDRAHVTLDGVEYQLEVNDNGVNSLHSGSHGFHSVLWTVEELSAQKIVFSYLSADGEQDFPGNMTVRVTYTLTDEDAVNIVYEAQSDKTTVANLTNHAYFNLDGHASGSIEAQQLQILAAYYTPVADSKSIPTGELAQVEGTPMDFRQLKQIGADIRADFAQLKYTGGYDHNYALDNGDGTLRLAARARAAHSGIGMDVYTDCDGVQFYSGNFIEKESGKEGVTYQFRQGFCLETQYFPNAVNEEHFKSPLLHPDEVYRSETTYKFYRI